MSMPGRVFLLWSYASTSYASTGTYRAQCDVRTGGNAALPPAVPICESPTGMCVIWLIPIWVTWLGYLRVVTHLCVQHDAFIRVTWLIHMCNMTHSYVRHGTFIRSTWRIHICEMMHIYLWHDACIRVTCFIHTATWLNHMCDMTHAYVWHDSFVCAARHIHVCDMNHSCAWHDSFISVTWLNHMCGMMHVTNKHTRDMTHSHVWHDSLTRVTWFIHLCNVSHSHLQHDSFPFLAHAHHQQPQSLHSSQHLVHPPSIHTSMSGSVYTSQHKQVFRSLALSTRACVFFLDLSCTCSLVNPASVQRILTQVVRKVLLCINPMFFEMRYSGSIGLARYFV